MLQTWMIWKKSWMKLFLPNDMVITLGAGSIWRYSESYMDHLAYSADGVTG